MNPTMPGSADARVREILQKIEITPEPETFTRQSLYDELRSLLQDLAGSAPTPQPLGEAIALIDGLEVHPRFTAEWKELFERLALLLTNHPSLVAASAPRTSAEPPL